MLYVLVVVILTTAFFCSCRSKESMTKEPIENKTEKQTAITDSVISKSLYTSEDTTFTNEETVIRKVTYDTNRMDSDGNHPIKSITDITKRKTSGSKKVKKNTLATAKVIISKQLENQRTTDNMDKTKKYIFPIKILRNLSKGILIILIFSTIILFITKYKKGYLLNAVKIILKRLIGQ